MDGDKVNFLVILEDPPHSVRGLLKEDIRQSIIDYDRR
ncbi:hypothetical protein Gogos_004628, partial [Gossypium gossypioides]|nr:hypothetical protein [Gossypium gossypioides]